MKYGVTDPERVGVTGLPDGRALGWARWGPEDGTPVLLFSGAAMGRSLGFGADVLGELGAGLISVDRPGLGASDPDPNRSLGDWATDVRHLASGLGLQRFGILGFSQGAPFALACAAAGVTDAVAVVSGQDELNHPAFSDMLPPDLAGMLAAAANDPDDFEAMVAADADADMMWRLVEEMNSERDLAVYKDPAFEPAYRRSHAEGFCQGTAGYARDLALTFGRWPFEPETVPATVDLWYGGHDASPGHSPDHGATLARRIPAARRYFLPEAGGSLLWTHSAEILDSLLATVRNLGGDQGQ